MNHFSWSFSILVATVTLALAPGVSAEFPVENMDSHSLGLQYGLTLRGENITQKAVPAHETIHALSIGYAPIQYLSLEAGIGIDAFSIENNNQTSFNGAYGFAPNFGLSLFSPPVFELLRITAGFKSLYLNSEDAAGFKYTALTSQSFLGAIISPIPYFSFSAGAKMFLMDGTMSTGSGQASNSQIFSNENILRGYFAITIKSPKDGAFLTLDLDASPGFDSDWSHGPREASVGIAFGTVLGHKRKQIVAADSTNYFPAFPSLKAKQDKMGEDLK